MATRIAVVTQNEEPDPEPQKTKAQQTQTVAYDYLTSEEIYERIRKIFLEDERTDPKCQLRS